MELVTYPDSEMMMIEVAQRLAGELRQRLSQGEEASIAVSGGRTPGPIFDALSAADLDWDRVSVLLTDERWVPEDSPRSNTRLVRERLLTGRAAAARFLPMYCDAPSPEEGIPRLVPAIAEVLPLTTCLLGMGEDMHTASIFPGADNLAEALTGETILVPIRAPAAPEPRLTLSAAVLAGALARHLVITGPEKREALERARSLPPRRPPSRPS
ncbi:6-phosphogluconolactonase [Rubellimicrobium thermophilum DSM 16684]|uniref:6-phosphogluconolactonase n=1 Tax=Rubellimicrobium thermophilum DSM 16684 TaxID=1123069 RepID=S9S8D2_9RHOB|nr:6-phosphogluconolactonase [Rubellimicrobium thermophilum DSM 16684]